MIGGHNGGQGQGVECGHDESCVENSSEVDMVLRRELRLKLTLKLEK